MSYMTTTGPRNGPPGPLDVLGAAPAGATGCGCARCALGADVTTPDPLKALAIGAAVVGVFLYLTKRVTRKR
jgi:hypothetical protein